MAKESRGFFERLTGARIMTREEEGAETETDFEYEDEAGDVEVTDQADDDFLEEIMDESDQETDETFSDEATEEPEPSVEEQEGQLTVDVFQDDVNVIIQSTIAGVTPDDLDVSITNDMVTIRGERRRTFDASQEDYFYQECYWGTFSRSIILPVEIDADRAEAKIKNGILTIRIPKTNAAMTRKLTITAS